MAKGEQFPLAKMEENRYNDDKLLWVEVYSFTNFRRFCEC